MQGDHFYHFSIGVMLGYLGYYEKSDRDRA